MYLNCHSYYSLRYGTMSIESLVEDAVNNGHEYLALTDINCSTGIFDFVRECRKNGIKPIAGVEYRQNGRLLYIGIARNLSGFRELNELLTKVNLGEMPQPLQSPYFKDVSIIYPTENVPEILQHNEYVGIRPSDLKKFKNPDLKREDKLVCLLSAVHKNTEEYELHQLLRCIDHNILYAQLSPNQRADQNDRFLTRERILKIFDRHPDIILNTSRLADQCEFEFNFSEPKNKRTFTGSRYEDKVLLESLALEGFKDRYSPDNQTALNRLYEELEVIDKLQFSCYFLTTWDVVRYSLNNGYFHVGRGSGANSLVAYCLKITEVDPIELNLYFSRFLNTKRTSPPDFDIDWSWTDRDDIIAYIFKRFGRDYTGFCGTVSDFKYRSVIRELGKVYGLPKEEMDQLTRTPFSEIHQDDITSKIYRFGEMLNGFPNQYSMHACGIFITEEPIATYSTMNIYPKGVPTCEIDMYIAESIGLEKLDILSQRGLGHIKEAVEIVRENKGIDLNISNTGAFKKDKACNSMLAEGRTLGCFYIESPAMRGLLRRLKCNNYETLVAASSIIRPGVAQSGMMREYVERHRDPKRIKYFHKVFEEQLSDTYGVMVYQEDVIKIAHHFAGLGLEEADVLRRGMSGKYRSKEEIERIQEKYFESCKKRGYSDELINEVYRQIASFAGYSFCKSHSASYAVESYQSLYLKAYYPLEFITAVINNNGGFYRPEVYINEARILGAKIEAPNINFSREKTVLIGETIYLGLNQVIHLSRKSQENIVLTRNNLGFFKDFQEFLKETSLTYDDVSYLVFVGAMRDFKLPKGQMIIEAKKYFNHELHKKPNDGLFEIESSGFDFPQVKGDVIADAFDELEGLGFPVSISPFDLLKTKFRGQILAKNLRENVGKVVKMVGYLVSIKDVPIKSKKSKIKMNFGTWIDVEGGYFDTTHFPQTLKQYPFKGLGCYLILGLVVEDFDFPSLEIVKMDRLPMVPDPRYSESDQPDDNMWDKLKVAHSFTMRDPYPSKEELDELYGRKPISGKFDHSRDQKSSRMQLGGRR